jgi:hypothetical protein
MSGTETPNLGLQYLDPSQAQPEVKVNDAWNKIDAAAFGALGVSVSDATTSPPIVAVARELKFVGATVSHETDGVALIQIDTSSDASDSGSSAIVIQLAASDLVTALTTATSVAYVRAAQAFTLMAVRSSLQTASSSGLVTVDIKKNGTTVLSTDLSIDATEKTSTTAATPAVISVPSISDDDELSIDITAAGTGATGLIVTLIGTA